MKALLKRLGGFFLSAAVIAAMLCGCGDDVDVIKAGESPEYEKTVTGDLYEYDVFTDHIAISKYTGSESRAEIPSEIDGMPVTKINSNSFYNCDKAVKTVVIPASVTDIEDNSFTGNKIESFKIDSGNASFTEFGGAVLDKEKTRLLAYACGSGSEKFTIPDTVGVIPSGVFSGARKLKTLEIPESVKEIETFALMGTGLTAVRLTAVEKLGMGAFWNCLDLTELELPECLAEISMPESVCRNCTSLKTVKGYDATDAKRIADADGVNAEYVSLG